jgi:hypothetical protein
MKRSLADIETLKMLKEGTVADKEAAEDAGAKSSGRYKHSIKC